MLSRVSGGRRSSAFGDRRESDTTATPFSAEPPGRQGERAELRPPSTSFSPVAQVARSPGAENEVTTGAPAAGLIVDDDTQSLLSGQLRKSEFLSELRGEACAAADRELARAGRDTQGCPVVDRLLEHYGGRSASYLERSLRKFVPGGGAVGSARDYVPLASARMASGVRRWVETGRIPEDVPRELRSSLTRGMVGASLGGVLDAVTGAMTSMFGAIGGAFAKLGSLFFKEAPGGSPAGVDRGAVSARLGDGRPLEGASKHRMESAFGHDFSHVRVHDDARAAGVAHDLNAHAFTLGSHVAFASGNYSPGSPVGDALLAHELAHVVQQSGARAGDSSTHTTASAAPDRDVERDADRGAVGALSALYGGESSSAKYQPRARGGLRLSRCAAKPEVKAPAVKKPTGPLPVLRPEGETFGDTPGYETGGLATEAHSHAQEVAGRGYWQEQALTELAVGESPETKARTKASAEEREAVYAVLWKLHKAGSLRRETPYAVTIPKRAKDTKVVNYSFTLRDPAPAVPGQPPDPRPLLDVHFAGEGSPVAAPRPAMTAGTVQSTRSSPGILPVNFPHGDFDGYFQVIQSEKEQLYEYLREESLGDVPRTVTTTTGSGAKAHTTTLSIGKGADGNAQVTFIAESAPVSASPPADYGLRDAHDFLLAQPGKDGARLGKLRVPPALPAEELPFVRNLVYQYFQSGTRGSEVDAIVPLPGARRILYTLKFHAPTNDVDVIRVGEAGVGTQVDPRKIPIDLGRIPDFSQHQASATDLKSWLGNRYPAITPPSGDTVPDVKASAEQKINEEAGKSDWFERNYDMKELSPAEAATRMATVHGLKPPQLVDFKEFTPGERRIVEPALETLSDPLIGLIKKTQLARQNVLIEAQGPETNLTFTPDPKTAGLQLTNSVTRGKVTTSDRSIILFDQFTKNDDSLFMGGPNGISSASMGTVVHEVGHAVGSQASIEAAFKAKFDTGPDKVEPITDYAKKKPVTESFPEAFALYNTDPQWMKENLLVMYEWFEVLAKTGAPPP
jgi:hypothetical protein